MEIVLIQLGGTVAVLGILLPQVLVVRRRVRALQEPSAGTPGTPVRSGRPVLVYLGVVVAVLVVSLLVAQLVSQLIEPAADYAALYLGGLVVVLAGAPLATALVLGGVLVHRLAQLRSLDRERGPGGPVPVGTAGVMTAAVVTCCAFGLGWVGFVFLAANSAIACARSPKCI